MNWFWVSCAVLMLGAAAVDFAHRRYVNASIAVLYAAANVLLGIPR